MTSVFLNGRWLSRFAALVLTALVAAGCVGVTASGSASVLPAASPTETASASASAIPTATPTATPTAVVDPLPSVPPAPSGTWKSINWTALPTTPEFGAHSLAAGSTFQVFGWSRGYVGFAITPGQPTDDQVAAGISADPTVVSSYSADGVHWHTGQKLDTAEASSNLAVIRTVIEGPAGLLAVGWWGSCASEYLDSLWTSSDGISWQPVNVSEAFGQQTMPITHVSGGAAGYVAVSYRSAGVWTSKDGRTWQRVPLGTGPFKNSLINDGTAISGGFVLAGTAGTPDCATTVLQDGETPPPPVSRTASVWWSADSSSWTRISLPGAVASSEYQETWVSRLSNQSLLVVNAIWGPSGPSLPSAWASKDGRTWTAVKLPMGINQPAIISGGQHNLIVEAAMGANDIGDPMVVSGKLGLQTIDDGFRLVSVAQSGDVPQLLYSNWDWGPYGMVALGPTGAVLTNAAGSQLWFGTPSAK